MIANKLTVIIFIALLIVVVSISFVCLNVKHGNLIESIWSENEPEKLRPSPINDYSRSAQIPSERSEMEDLTTDKIGHCDIVAMSKGEMKIDKTMVRERVDRGLSQMSRGILTEKKQILSISDAHKHLMGNEVFMDTYIPEFGIETGEYYVFSGYRGAKPDDAFLVGCAVRKIDGFIFKWWLPEAASLDSR